MSTQDEAQGESVHSPADGAVGGVGMVRILASWTIATVSLALIAGFAYWAISLGTRDPNEVPIIRAMEGPARVAPEDPGGKQASHQGLAVNKVQAEGGVEDPSERVVLAPLPEDLAAEDAAGTNVTPMARPTAAAVRESLDAAKPETDLVAAAIRADQSAQEVVTDVAVDASTIRATNIRDTAYSPARSPRPQVRPSGLATELESVTQTAAAEPGSEFVESVPIGTRLVQLGAYDSTELAISEWKKLFGKHSDLLEGKKRLVQSAESGGRKFYRLRAVGFVSLDESQTLCTALLARGTPCIPVTAR